MWGIDVSKHQGSIDWRAVSNHGVQFVIMKAMKETSHSIDERFVYNYEQSALFGLERGAYIYVIATNAAEAHIEAMDFIRTVQNRQFERGIWLDLEDSKIRNIGKDKLTEIIKVETSVLEAHGYQVGLYSNLDWYLHVLDGAALSKSFSWWIARYPKADDGTMKLVLKPLQESVSMWQYSSKGNVDGIRGYVDMDFDIADLNLDYNQLASQIIGGMWGNGEVRKRRLEAAGYDFIRVQQIVTQMLHDAKFYPKYSGLSIRIDVIFKEIGVSGEYLGNKSNRCPIAHANGITDYRGTLTQNLKLISLARSGDLRRP